MPTPITSTLLEAPHASTKISAAISTLNFDRSDWLRIFNAECGPYSNRRKYSRETTAAQISRLPQVVYEDDPCDASADLARRIAELPELFKYAIIEVHDRFWMPRDTPASFEEIMVETGVILDPSNHQRLSQKARRKSLIEMS
jgi:hypothetical protein